mmetsp:Transcript_6648/g.10984  ORF Transcript_6648/g.10984 Transcript_6648/m.10984 type:complete len:359 (+) Transcript_6648:236-1312(+)
MLTARGVVKSTGKKRAVAKKFIELAEKKKRGSRKRESKKKLPNDLVKYAGKGKLKKLRKLLTPLSGKRKISANKRNSKGGTALTEACYHGKVDTVHYLLEEAKANVNTPTRKGVSALMVAGSRGHVDVMEVLLECKADIDTESADGSTALMAAAFQKEKDAIKFLLKARANVNAKKKNGCTALSIASEGGILELVKILVESKADVNARTLDGSTALMYAAYYENFEVVRFLIANSNADCLIENNDGKTACNLAEEKSNERLVDYLGRAERMKKSRKKKMLRERSRRILEKERRETAWNWMGNMTRARPEREKAGKTRMRKPSSPISSVHPESSLAAGQEEYIDDYDGGGASSCGCILM